MKIKILFLAGLLLTVVTHSGCSHQQPANPGAADTNAAAERPASEADKAVAPMMSSGSTTNEPAISNLSSPSAPAMTNAPATTNNPR